MKKVVLIVDDQRESMFLKEQLIESNADVVVVNDLKNGVETIDRIQPDVVFIDTKSNKGEMEELFAKIMAEKWSKTHFVIVPQYGIIPKKGNFIEWMPTTIRPKLLLLLLRNLLNSEPTEWVPALH